MNTTSKLNLMDAHNQWANRPTDQRYETLDALAAAVHGRRLRSRSMDLECAKVEANVSPDGALVINSAITACEPSHWAFGQLSQVAKAPAGYLRTLPRELIVQNLNHGLKHAADNDEVKFMTIADEDGGLNTLQAVTSTTYGRIWDADCVGAVQRIVERSGGKFYNPKAYVGGQQRPSGLYASDRDVFMFMIDGGSRLDVGPRAQLNRGFIVWNSETGSKTFGLMTFLFNEVCGNHIIWGASEVNRLLIRHTCNGPTRFDTEAAPALAAYVESSAVREQDVIIKAQSMLVTANGTRDEFSDWLNKQGKFTKAEIIGGFDFAKAEEGDCRTLWQAVQGLTAYARGFDYVDARVDLEKRAGNLLNLASN